MKQESDSPGSVMTLAIGLFVVVVSLCTLGADVSSLWVTRHGLDSVADGAALAAAQAVDAEVIYRHGLTSPVRLNPVLAKEKVTAYVTAANAKARFVGLRIRSVNVTNSRVHVELQCAPDLPFGYLVPSGGGVILASAEAELKLGR